MACDKDDALMARLEQAETVMEAWVRSLPSAGVEQSESCIDPIDRDAYIAGSLDPDRAISILDHLSVCSYCRAEVRDAHHLACAKSNTQDCILDEIRKIMEKKPEFAAGALVRLSQDIVSITFPKPSQQPLPRLTDLGVLSTLWEPTGEWLSLIIERAPYIDPDYNLRLDVRALPKECEGVRLRIFVKVSERKIELGSVILNEGMTRLTIDLSDLCVRPGCLSHTDLELIAQRFAKDTPQVQPDLLQTGPQKISGARLRDQPQSITDTTTPGQLTDMLAVRHRSSEDAEGAEQPTTKTPGKRRKE